MLEQYRHALQGTPLCFLRGFGEDDIDLAHNVKKEMKEELGSDCVYVKEIGNVSSDSGLTSGIATVLVAGISEPNIIEGYEGIKAVHFLSEEELKSRIHNREITDGFTLSALSLYWSRGVEF